MNTPFDAAIDLLHQTRQHWASENTLVYMTEGLASLNTQGCNTITNRFDLFEQLKQNKQKVTFSDFVLADCQALTNSPAAVVMRVDKEKPLSHYLFNLTATLLKDGGEFWLVGHKNEGLKTYLKKIGKLLIGEQKTHKGKEGYQCIQFKVEYVNDDNLFDDSDYTQIRSINQKPDLLSKPGQYGWKKIDKGSQLLIQKVVDHYVFSDEDRVLDLGCGYGYLAAVASQLPYGEMIATDNNAASVISAKANFEALDIKGEVVAADCAKGLEGRFNLILCNPPFHTGFAHDQQLTAKFSQTIASRLRRKGKAYIVVNQFINMAELLTKQGLTVTELDHNQGYRIYLAHR